MYLFLDGKRQSLRLISRASQPPHRKTASFAREIPVIAAVGADRWRLAVSTACPAIAGTGLKVHVSQSQSRAHAWLETSATFGH